MSFSYWVRALGIVKIYGKAGQKKIDTGQGDMCHLEFKGIFYPVSLQGLSILLVI